MIDAKDLRITNWVLLDGEPYFIRAGEQIDDYNDRMKGIQINPEILAKCGYLKDPLDGNFYKEGSGLPPLYWIYKTKWNMQGLPLNGHNIQYLHQLQNLYHALTGEELKINL